MSADTPADLLTLGPAPSPAYFAVDLGLVCAACAVVFTAQRACPACAATDLYPLDVWFARRQGRTHEAETVAELRALRVIRSA